MLELNPGHPSHEPKCVNQPPRPVLNRTKLLIAKSKTFQIVFSKMGHSWPLYLYFGPLFFNVKLVDKILPMLGFEQRISGVGSDRATN